MKRAFSRVAARVAPTSGLPRGEYLVRAVGHCGECHTPRSAPTMAVDNSRFLAGNGKKSGPEGEAPPNITPDKEHRHRALDLGADRHVSRNGQSTRRRRRRRAHGREHPGGTGRLQGHGQVRSAVDRAISQEHPGDQEQDRVGPLRPSRIRRRYGRRRSRRIKKQLHPRPGLLAFRGSSDDQVEPGRDVMIAVGPSGSLAVWISPDPGSRVG